MRTCGGERKPPHNKRRQESLRTCEERRGRKEGKERTIKENEGIRRNEGREEGKKGDEKGFHTTGKGFHTREAREFGEGS